MHKATAATAVSRYCAIIRQAARLKPQPPFSLSLERLPPSVQRRGFRSESDEETRTATHLQHSPAFHSSFSTLVLSACLLRRLADEIVRFREAQFAAAG